jgi:tetratricopeptide (TPR) repeat protein
MGRYGIDWGESENDLTEEDYKTIFAETSKIISEKNTDVREISVAFYDRGNVFQSRGAIQSAISDYSSAIELQNDYEAAYYNRGGAFFLLEMYDEALLNYRKAFEIDPKDKDAQDWVEFLTGLKKET